MDMELKKNGTELTAAPVERMDTETSPVIRDQIIAELDGVTSLIIDLAAVDYVSSGGLRALLTLQQEMESRGGTMKVMNVNEYIKEVFEITGFLDILTIE